MNLAGKDSSPRFRGLQYGCTMAGAAVIAEQIKDSMVIIHGPVGCIHQNIAMQVSMALRRQIINDQLALPFSPPRMVSTCLQEADMVFGGEGRLKEVVLEVYQRHRPNLISIVSACAVEVIGDNIRAIAKELERELGIPILVIESGGFMGGGYEKGVRNACRDLIENLVAPPRDRFSDRVNILGEKSMSSEVDWNYKEIKRWLDCLGISVHTRFAKETTLTEIKTMAESRLNLISSYETGLLVAQILKEKFGQEYLARDFPTGLAETEAWLEELGKYFRQEEKAAELIGQEKSRFYQTIQPLRMFLAGKRVIINTLDKNIEWLVELIDQAGMEFQAINIFSLMPEDTSAERINNLGISRPGLAIKKRTSLAEIEEEVKEAKPQLCLSFYPLELDLPGTVFSTIPMVPRTGTAGTLGIAKEWARLLRNPYYKERWRTGD